MTSQQAPHTAVWRSEHDGEVRAGQGRSSWRTINISPVERVGRVVLGLAAVITGIVLLTGATSAFAVVLEVLLVLAGLDILITGVLGHCALYQKLGFVPKSLRGSR